MSSFSFNTPSTSPIKDDKRNPDQQTFESDSSQILDQPYPLPDGYTHGLMCYGFKLVGDNLDKTVKPRDMRIDHTSQSLHYFNVYAVLDRVDFRSMSCDTKAIEVEKVDSSIFLPSTTDMEEMINNFTVIVSRLLVKYIPALSEYIACVPNHIDHKYSREMSAKSHVVRT